MGNACNTGDTSVVCRNGCTYDSVKEYNQLQTRYALCFTCHSTYPFLRKWNYQTGRDKTQSDYNAVYGWVLDIYSRQVWGIVKTQAQVYNEQWKSHFTRHWRHLNLPANRHYPDATNFGGRFTCITCHNVHGSSNLTMIRDGRSLENPSRGMEWLYWDGLGDSPYTQWSNGQEISPTNTNLAQSTSHFDSNRGNFCGGCHGNSWSGRTVYYKDYAIFNDTDKDGQKTDMTSARLIPITMRTAMVSAVTKTDYRSLKPREYFFANL